MGFYMRVKGRLKRFPITWAQHTHQCMRGISKVHNMFHPLYTCSRGSRVRIHKVVGSSRVFASEGNRDPRLLLP
jgi:hypothetical protein